ncbi:hypothetical protein N9408_01900 [Opitutales bacterium]|nr:hypothetical protein [Opitutales bacterium]
MQVDYPLLRLKADNLFVRQSSIALRGAFAKSSASISLSSHQRLKTARLALHLWNVTHVLSEST